LCLEGQVVRRTLHRRAQLGNGGSGAALGQQGLAHRGQLIGGGTVVAFGLQQICGFPVMREGLGNPSALVCHVTEQRLGLGLLAEAVRAAERTITVVPREIELPQS
jgi:hypothetical protein